MGVLIVAVRFFISGALFVGVLSQAGTMGGNYPQGGGNQQTQGAQGGRGTAVGQGGWNNRQNGADQRQYPPNGNQNAGQYRGGGSVDQNRNGGGGQYVGTGPAGNNRNPSGGQYTNGGQYGGRNPAGPNGNPINGQYGGGRPATPNGNPINGQYGGGRPAGPNRYPNGGQDGGRFPTGPNGNPNSGQYGGGRPNQRENGSGPNTQNDENLFLAGGTVNENDLTGGIELASLPPEILAGLVRVHSGSQKSSAQSIQSMALMSVNSVNSAEPSQSSDEDEPADEMVHTETIQCDQCKRLLNLPVFVDGGDDADAPPTYNNDKEKKFKCENFASFGNFFEESTPAPIEETTPVPTEETTTMEPDIFRHLTCGDDTAIGLAWRYEPLDPKEPEGDKYIRHLAMVCDANKTCIPFLGNNSVWTQNEADQPHNASMCVPGDHLTGVDITYRGPLMIDIRSKCCTSTLIPNCKMEYQQLLKISNINGNEQLCEFCQPQEPTREELIIHETESNRWHSKDYKVALHRLFLRFLTNKRDVPIHPNSTDEHFKKAGIIAACPFTGTSLQPGDHLDFWPIGSKHSDRCGIPVVQRVFVAVNHSIEYFSVTARAVMPGSGEIVMLPQAVAWSKSDPCIEGC